MMPKRYAVPFNEFGDIFINVEKNGIIVFELPVGMTSEQFRIWKVRNAELIEALRFDNFKQEHFSYLKVIGYSENEFNAKTKKDEHIPVN